MCREKSHKKVCHKKDRYSVEETTSKTYPFSATTFVEQ